MAKFLPAVVLALTFLLVGGHAAEARVARIIHLFEAGTLEGQDPGPLTAGPDGAAYGVTRFGAGGNDESLEGTLYRIDADGNVTVLQSNLAMDRTAKLVLRGDTLYFPSGSAIYSIRTDGSNFRLVHAFDGSDGVAFGVQPFIVVGADRTIYGVTAIDAFGDYPSLFALPADGPVTILYQLPARGALDMLRGLVSNGAGRLIGTDEYGVRQGDYTCGTIFTFDLAAQRFTTVHRYLPTEGCFATLDGVDDSGRVYGQVVDYAPTILFRLVPAKAGYSIEKLARTSPKEYFSGAHVSGNGDLIGTTTAFRLAGDYPLTGTLFRWSKGQYKTLNRFFGHAFSNYARPVILTDGEIVGSAASGGDVACHNGFGCGLIYRYGPP